MTSTTVPASDRPEPSPLTDYLADVEKSFDAELGSSVTTTTPLTDRDRRKSRRQSTPFYTKGIPTSPGPPVTHLDLAKAAEAERLKVPSTPMPMRSDKAVPSPSPSPLPASSLSRSPLSRPPVLRRPTDDGFTERFQYLVASSGLLEKTQILSLGSSHEDDDSPAPSVSDDDLQMIVRSQQQHRWDLYAASAVVLVSVLYVLGLSMLLVPSAAVAGGAALFLPSKVDSVTEVATDDKRDSIIQAKEKEEPTPPEDSTTRVFNTLNTLLAESRSLDQAIGSAMSLLSPRPDDIENAHSLRIALHRLFSDMTDSLAATTSTLIPMADRSELAVLGDMYDIPVLGNRRRRASSSSSEGSTTTTPMPHRQRSLSTSEAVTTAVGDDPSALQHSTADASDRFTPLPVRHLRHKRSTSRGLDYSPANSPLRPYHHQRDASTETRQREGDESLSLTSCSTDSSSVPASLPEQRNGARSPVGPASRAAMMSFTPKRASPLGHTLERPDVGPSSFPAAARTTSPTSFHMRPSQSAFRRSLQDIPYIHTPPSSSAAQAAELAKARATSNMSSAKRRSLQTPYNFDLQREQVLVQANAGGLTRASSLTYGNRNAHSDALAALEGKRSVSEATKPPGLRPLTMSASLSTPSKRASAVIDGRMISPPKPKPQQQHQQQQQPPHQLVESQSRQNRNSIILESSSAAITQSDAMSSKRSSTTLEGQQLLSSPEGSATSKRSSLLLDQGPAGRRVQQLLGEQSQNALGLGQAPRAASLGVQNFQRVPSVSPLTLGGLKASCHGVHLNRRRVVCCLLGLRFNEPRSSSYWSDVCGEMRKLTEAMVLGRESLEGAREEVEKELNAAKSLAEMAKRHSMPAPSNDAPGTHVDHQGPAEFAPRSDPMLSSVEELQRTLARVWQHCDELRQRGVSLEPDILAGIWADVRSDVGGMLRQVERGREAVRSTNVSEAGVTEPTDSEIMPISASSAGDIEPGFLRAWENAAHEAEEIERLVEGDDLPPDSEPYQEFLPPPGMDEVFEAAIPPAPAPRAKSALSRDERIKLNKEARARSLAMDKLTANSKESSPEPEVEMRRAGGDVMQELQGVFGVIRQRKGYSQPPPAEQPTSTPISARYSTPTSTPGSARVTTPASAPRLVASPSRSPSVRSPTQPAFGLPRMGSPTFRVTSPTSTRPASPPNARVMSPRNSRVTSPPPRVMFPGGRVLSPTPSDRVTSPTPRVTASGRSPSPAPRTATLSRTPSMTRSPSSHVSTPSAPRMTSPDGSTSSRVSSPVSRSMSMSPSRMSTGARKQRGLSLQPIAAVVPMAMSPEAERRRSLQTLYEQGNGSQLQLPEPIHLRSPEEVAEDEIGVAI